MRFMHCMITVRFNNCDAFTAQHTATWHHSQCNCVHMQYLSTISFHDVDKQWFWWTEAVPKQTQCTPFKQHSVNKTMNQFTRSPICFGLTWVAGHHRMRSHHIYCMCKAHAVILYPRPAAHHAPDSSQCTYDTCNGHHNCITCLRAFDIGYLYIYRVIIYNKFKWSIAEWNFWKCITGGNANVPLRIKASVGYCKSPYVGFDT